MLRGYAYLFARNVASAIKDFTRAIENAGELRALARGLDEALSVGREVLDVVSAAVLEHHVEAACTADPRNRGRCEAERLRGRQLAQPRVQLGDDHVRGPRAAFPPRLELHEVEATVGL